MLQTLFGVELVENAQMELSRNKMSRTVENCQELVRIVGTRNFSKKNQGKGGENFGLAWSSVHLRWIRGLVD